MTDKKDNERDYKEYYTKKDLVINAAYQKLKKLEQTGIITKESLGELIQKQKNNLNNISNLNKQNLVSPSSSSDQNTKVIQRIKNKYIEYKKLKSNMNNIKLGILTMFFASSGYLIYKGPYKKQIHISLSKAIFLPFSVAFFANYIIQSIIKAKYKENLNEIIKLKLKKDF